MEALCPRKHKILDNMEKIETSGRVCASVFVNAWSWKQAVMEEGMRSAVCRPCERALTIPANYDTHLLCPFYITQRGGSLVEFDSWVSYSSLSCFSLSDTHTHKHVGTQGTFELGFFHPSNFKVFLCSKSDTVPFGIYVYVPIRSALCWCSSLHLSYGLETHLHFVQNVLFTFGLEDQIIIVSRLYLHFYAPLQSSTLNPVNRWQRFSIFWITV